jgi:hypothetical protein
LIFLFLFLLFLVFLKTLSVGHASAVAVGCDVLALHCSDDATTTVLALHCSDDATTTARSGLIDQIIWENFLNSKHANKLRERKYVF